MLTRTRPSRALLLLMLLALVAAACSSSTNLEPIAQPTNEPEPTAEAEPDPDPEPTATPDEPDETPTAEPTPTEAPAPTIPAFTAPDPDPTLLPLSDNVRIGTLDNGLTYYLRRNDSPGSSVELRMAVNAGAMQQFVADSGRAHFLEHMMFNGTTAYPDNELDEVLRTIGAEIGPDLNAYTSSDETVYILSLGANDDETVDTGFGVLREWAGNATIDPQQVIDERGVVQEEWRLGNSSSFAAVNDLFELAYTQGSPYEDRSPIGTEANIVSTTAEQLRELYEAWYRPELMAIIAVGDLPLDEMEEQVISRFSDLENPAAAPAYETPVVELIDEPFIEVLAAPDQPEKFISLDMSLPAWDTGTVGGERYRWIEILMGLMLTNRLEESSTQGRSNLIGPGAGPFAWSRNQSFMGFNTDADDLSEGTAFLLTELHRLRITGFEGREFDQAVQQILAFVDSEVGSADSIQDTTFADLYVSHYLANAEISDVGPWGQRMTDLMADLDVTDVDNHFRWMMDVSAPLVILVSNDEADLPTKAELEEIVTQAEIDGLGGVAGEAGAEVVEIDQLMDPPAAVSPLTTGNISDPDASWRRYENGVTVVVAESTIQAGQVNIWSASGGGYSLLEPGDGPLTRVATDAVGESGFDGIERVSVDRFLADSSAAVFPYIGETREGFSGSSTAEDLETAMQLMHLFITAPTVDENGFRKALAQAEDTLGYSTTDADQVLFTAVGDLASGGDPYQVTTPTQDQLDDLTPETLLGLYQSRLGKVDDLVVAVVGDIDEDDVFDLADQYLGTLPTGPEDTWVDVRPSWTAGELTVQFGDAGDTAAVIQLFENETDVTADMGISGAVLSNILNERIFDEVREALGASYGGSASIQTFLEPDERIQLVIFVSGDPDQIQEITDTVNGELADIVANGVRVDEFDRAVAIATSDLAFSGNDLIIDQVMQWAEHPDEEYLTLVSRNRLIGELTIGQVNDLAALTLGEGVLVQATRVPVGN